VGVEIELPVQAESILEVAAPDRDNEIVYLYCTLKDPNNRQGMDGKPYETEVTKAGEHSFKMRAGQVAKMKRSLAEWHVAKTSSFDAIHFHLKLEVKTETEMADIKAALEAEAKVREARAKVLAEQIAKQKEADAAAIMAEAARIEAEEKAKKEADAAAAGGSPQ